MEPKENFRSVMNSSETITKNSYRNYNDIFLSDKYRNINFLPVEKCHTPVAFSIDPSQVNKFFTEGCIVRSLMMGVGGAGIGLLFGTFFFTMRPAEIDTTLPFRQQMKESYKGFGTEVKSMSKNFAKLSLIYSLVECFIERERASHDITNAVYAGCVTGAALAWKSGAIGMASSCGMFAAFSAVMEYVQPFSSSD